jgi:undecaprenyl-diphosphatase
MAFAGYQVCNMETVWIAVLGAIQGATEFLPVSSSGHLAAVQMVLAKGGDRLANQPLTLEILLHLATLLAVIVFYRRDVLDGICGAGRALVAFFKGRGRQIFAEDDGANLALAVVVGTIPTGIIGLTIEDSAMFISQSSLGLGLTFCGCACLLLASRWWPGGKRRLSWKTALIIGVIQGIAVLPGISRSGATIAAALALGLDREQAARFSFLLSIPAILGAALLKLDPAALANDDRLWSYLLGGLVAFGVGLAALYLLVKLVRGGRLWIFSPYLATAGIVTLLVI